MFASIPNFQDFYSEDIENGKACIRILNEIICELVVSLVGHVLGTLLPNKSTMKGRCFFSGDFDALLEEPRFASIEKIKTVGATYMAAAGLNPKHLVRTLQSLWESYSLFIHLKQVERGETAEDSVCDLVEFALAMKQKLQEVNKDAFNTFQLRVGKNRVRYFK